MADDTLPDEAEPTQGVGMVYGLTTQADGLRIRYIGFTVHTMKHRLKRHRASSKRTTYPVSKWFAEREAAGHQIICLVLKQHAVRDDEDAFIAQYRAEGADILNLCGGDIPSPLKGKPREMTEEHKANIRAAMARRSYSELHERLAATWGDPEKAAELSRKIKAGHGRRSEEAEAERVRKIQAARAQWTPEQHAAALERRRATYAADPEKEQRRREAIAAGHARRRANGGTPAVNAAHEAVRNYTPEQKADLKRRKLEAFHRTIAARKAAKQQT